MCVHSLTKGHTTWTERSGYSSACFLVHSWVEPASLPGSRKCTTAAAMAPAQGLMISSSWSPVNKRVARTSAAERQVCRQVYWVHMLLCGGSPRAWCSFCGDRMLLSLRTVNMQRLYSCSLVSAQLLYMLGAAALVLGRQLHHGLCSHTTGHTTGVLHAFPHICACSVVMKARWVLLCTPCCAGGGRQEIGQLYGCGVSSVCPT